MCDAASVQWHRTIPRKEFANFSNSVARRLPFYRIDLSRGVLKTVLIGQFRFPLCQLFLQALDDGTMHLTNAAFGQI